MSDWTHAKNNPEASREVIAKVRARYRERLVLPDTKPAKQFLLCPVGLVGAGKSTVIRPLAQKLGIPRVSTDAIREMLKSKGFNYNPARDLAYSIVEELVQAGHSVAVDSNCGSDDALQRLKSLQEKYPFKLIWLRVNPPESFILSKLKNYRHTWLFKDTSEALKSYFKYKERYGDFENLDVPYLYTFDTSRPNMKDQIEEACSRIENELSRSQRQNATLYPLSLVILLWKKMIEQWSRLRRERMSRQK